MSVFGWKRLYYFGTTKRYLSPIYQLEWMTRGPTRSLGPPGIHAAWLHETVSRDYLEGDLFVIEGGGEVVIGEEGWIAEAAWPVAAVESKRGAEYFGIPSVTMRIATALINNNRRAILRARAPSARPRLYQRDLSLMSILVVPLAIKIVLIVGALLGISMMAWWIGSWK